MFEGRKRAPSLFISKWVGKNENALRRLLFSLALLRHRRRFEPYMSSFWHTLRGLWEKSPVFLLRTPNDKQESLCRVSPTNLLALFFLWERGYPAFAGVEEGRRFRWEIAPQRYFITRGDFPWEVSSFYEVFVEGCYRVDRQIERVIDIGAFNGDTVAYFALQGAEVLALEPDPFHAEMGIENVKLASLEEQVCWVIGAWSVKRQRLLFSPPPPPYRASFEVEGYPLEDLLQTKGWSSVCLAKVSCEGCEKKIILQLSHETLRRAEMWMIRQESYAPSVREKLQEAGFAVEERPVQGATLLIAQRR
ncbi:MAG: FkbM family methyltransferase [Bacteroidia bacterium]|nr:FkbM family methyltransferase [Bacteroidia bacterium]MDW8134329.1 FkbM family methyltransferase [Bacteroidia bacterium]